MLAKKQGQFFSERCAKHRRQKTENHKCCRKIVISYIVFKVKHNYAHLERCHGNEKESDKENYNPGLVIHKVLEILSHRSVLFYWHLHTFFGG